MGVGQHDRTNADVGPPTPPQQDNDVYCDQCLSFLYDTRTVMSETQLPPIYVRRAEKRSRHDSGFNDNRRPMKIARKEETNVPKSLFHSPALIRMRRDMKIQKLRGMVRNAVPISKSNVQKNVDQPLAYEWFLHEDQAILKVLRKFQGLPLNPASSNPGHTPNWDFVADYVNTLSITYRSPKHCKHRYETVLVQREEGKVSALIDVQFKKKKNKANVLQKPYSNKSRSTPTLLMNDDNIYNFTQLMIKRFESLKSIANKRLPTTRTVVNNPLMNKTKTTVLNECGIDLDHPVLPVEVAARRAERMAKEKKLTSTELARLQMMKGIIANQQGNNANSTTVPIVVSSNPQIIVTSTITTTTVTITTPSTAPSTLRTQRLIASPLQTSSVMSVSGLSPAQLQAATQRLIVPAGTSAAQAKTVVATAGVQGKQITPAQLLLRQTNLKQQLRIHANNLAGQGVKTSTVTIGGQQAVVQFSQAQQPRAQFVRQGTVTVGGKTGVPRAVSETEMAQLLKKQHLQQQQKLSVAGTSTIQSLSSQVLAQAIQAGTSGTPVATLVKAVSTSGVTQTVTIPVTGVTLTSQGKTLTPTLKTTNPNQIRQFNIQQQQLLTQKKLAGQKLSIAQVAGKSGNLQTQLIVGSKPLSTGMTVQQFQQVIRSPLNVSHTPVVLTKGPPRVIPVNTAQGTKQTIQVVAATSQTLTTALRPQSSSTLAGALTGIKVNASSATQQALLSLNQNVGVRQGSPVRIQTTTGTPIVAVSVQNVVQTATTSAGNAAEQVSKFFKK